MIGFKQFLDESHEDDVHGMGQYLSQFMHHLSSPIGKHDDEELTEWTNPALEKSADGKLSMKKNLPKSAAMIEKGNAEIPEGNHHKRISDGFSKAFNELETEHPTVTKQKHKEAKAAWSSFAKARGLKGDGGSFMTENGKTRKSSGEGVHTKGIGLAPHASNGLKGFDVCPRASSECRANCLGTEAGGNKQYPDNSLSRKVRMTHFMVQHPEHAARMLDHELGQHVKSAKKKGMIPGVRLNVTSDIPYEKFAGKMFKRHSEASFYDYTKVHQRVMGQGKESHPANYHLSLSHTGTGHEESNDKHVVKALEAGHVVAMVHQRGKGTPEPTHVEDVKSGKRYPIANGDKDDNTFDRHTTLGVPKTQGVVSGLKLKGVSNDRAGHFANKVDHDGIIRINK